MCRSTRRRYYPYMVQCAWNNVMKILVSKLYSFHPYNMLMLTNKRYGVAWDSSDRFSDWMDANPLSSYYL